MQSIFQNKAEIESLCRGYAINES